MSGHADATIEVELQQRSPGERVAHLEGVALGMKLAADTALKLRYGPPSMWPDGVPAGWHLPGVPCQPAWAYHHDNGCVDAFKAIKALQAALERRLG